MKVKVLIAAFMIAGIAPAQAADEGAWVKVDANGNAAGQAIVCTADVCGDSNSDYAKATLKPGERYVLQFRADPITNNSAGIGNHNPGVQVKVDLATNNWTVTSVQAVESPKSPATNESVKITTKTVQTFNPYVQPTPVVETVKTVEREIITDWNDPDFDWEAWWTSWLAEWEFLGHWWWGL